MSIVLWAQEAVLLMLGLYWTVWDRYMQVLYLGRALRTKETLPNFLKWRRVTRHPLVFHGLTGSQRTPGFGASHIYFFTTCFISYHISYTFHVILYFTYYSCNCILSSYSSVMLLISCHIFYSFHLHIVVIFFYVSCLHKP